MLKLGFYLWCFVSICSGQTVSLEGSLMASPSADLSHLRVRLVLGGRGDPQQVFVSATGSFRFAHLAQGNYTLTVIDELGNEITEEQVDVPASVPEIEVRLPEDPAAQRPGGPVSVAQLRHKPEGRALRELIAAEKLSAAGDHEAAAALLEQAVARDPGFAEAHGNLGAQYVRMHQFARAVSEFERAIALDPSNAFYSSNLALALAETGRRTEAAGWARHALAIDSTNAPAHYVLGCLLAGENGGRAEAIHHLESAEQKIPAARALLDQLRK